MNTKLLMTASAVILGIMGIVLTFMPEEASIFFNLTGDSALLFQILGALYFSFAMLNWTAKGNLIGGIYSRPVSIANLTHFLIGGLALIKISFSKNAVPVIWVLTILYVIFAILFAYVFFTSPKPSKQS